MNQEKIGKLIAKLRKEKGLTQQQLGDMVGVGYRAVSKWETGLTLPDISIINDLCNILGITSDELLKGELNKKPPELTNKKFNKKLLLLLIPVIIIAIIIGIIIKENSKTYTYDLKSTEPKKYQIEGKLVFKGNRLSVYIDKLKFGNYEFSQTIIKNYQYKVLSNEKPLFGFGYNSTNENLLEQISIAEFQKTFTISYSDKVEVSKNWILKNNLTLDMTFIDIDNNIINKKIEILLIAQEKTKSTT